MLFTAQVPLLVGLCSGALLVSLVRRWEYWPFLLTLGLFALCLLGLGVSMFPYVVPNAVTIHEAAAPQSSLLFMLVGASVLIPIILAYSGILVLGVPRQDRTRGIPLMTNDLEQSSTCGDGCGSSASGPPASARRSGQPRHQVLADMTIDV